MVVKMLKRRLKVNKNMDYLFLRRHRRTATSKRQKNLLLKAAERQWELQFANKGAEGRKVDCTLYKCILYNLEIKQVFLDSELSLKKISETTKCLRCFFYKNKLIFLLIKFLLHWLEYAFIFKHLPSKIFWFIRFYS